MDKKIWKMIALDYNQNMILLILYTNARFSSTGTTSDFATTFVETYMNEKLLKK